MASASPATGPAKSNALSLDAWNALVADRDKLGLPDLTIVPLADYLRDSADPAKNPDILPSEQWPVVLDQAVALLGNLYPHLPFKIQDFKADPLGFADTLRASLQHSPPIMTELDFHIEMLKLFATVRDPHTVYILPRFFHGAIAFLPFRAGFYDDPGADNEISRRKFIVTSVMKGFDHPTFRPGVEIVGYRADISAEIERAASLSPGANKNAQLQRGLLRLSLRPLATSGSAGWREPFENEIASITYLVPGSTETHFIGLPWGVGKSGHVMESFPSDAFSMSCDLFASHFAANVIWNRREIYGQAPQASGEPTPAFDPSQKSQFPDVFEFQSTSGVSGHSAMTADNLIADSAPHKEFGYIAIKRFNTSGSIEVAEELPAEFARILKIMRKEAPDGLILDIRGNPGGDIVAAELMLQMLTPRTITPANFHLANTPATNSVLKTVGSPLSPAHQLKAWLIDEATAPLGPLTPGHPLTPDANALGQVYQAPVALLVDALTYSAADIFTGGFMDNQVGVVIGSDSSTGGGGASLWTHGDLIHKFQPSSLNLQPLPAGISMSVAFLRSSRVNARLNQPIEDIGVQPDVIVPRTLNDLLSQAGNPVMSDLVKTACDHLAALTPHRIEIVSVVELESAFSLNVTAVNIAQLEFILDESVNPKLTIPAQAAAQPVIVPFHSNGVRPARITVRGNSASELLATVIVDLGPPETDDGGGGDDGEAPA